MATSTQAKQVSSKVDFTGPLNTAVLQGKSVLITGGASGLGRGIATAIAEAGAYVTIADISATAGRQAEQNMQKKGLHLQFIETDVSSHASQLFAFKSAIAYSPSHSLDLVIAGAGVPGACILDHAFPPDLPAGADPPAPPTRVLDVNLTGVYYTTVLALHYFKTTRPEAEPETQPQKHLLLVASYAAYGGIPLSANYMAAKYGVRALFKSMRDYGPALGNVRVNLLAPWWIETHITSHISQNVMAAGVRFGGVDDFVQGAMRCCCDERIVGRAVVVTPPDPKSGVPGSGNFDICDDWEGHEGFRELKGHYSSELFYEGEVVDLGRLWGYEV